MRDIDLAHEAEFRLGPLRVIPSLRRVAGSDQEIIVEPKAMQVLVVLSDTSSPIYSRDDLIERCWQGRIIGDTTINRIISILRSALRKAAGDAVKIETISKVGYRLVVAGEAETHPDAAVEADVAAADRSSGSPANEDPKSLVVLPLANGTGQPQDQFFVDGMHQAIIVELSKISGLQVISRVSANVYREANKSSQEIGAELGIGIIIDGLVTRSAGSVEIAINVSEAASGASLWAESFEASLPRIVEMHRKIALEVARRLRGHRQIAPVRHETPARDVNPVAYENYLKGMYHWYRLSPEDLRLAEESFERALEADPDYGPAHSGIASMWAGMQQMNAISPTVSRPRIKRAIAKSRTNDAGSFQAVLADAVYLTWSEFNWEAAERCFKRSLEMNPDFPDTNAFYSHLLNILGRFSEAKPYIEHARRLDPFNPLIGSLYCVNLQFWGEFEAATLEQERIVKAAPDMWLAFENLRISYRALERIPELVKATVRMYEILGDDGVANILKRFKSGTPHEPVFCEAAQYMRSRNTEDYVSSMAIAELYDTGGDIHSAAEYIEKGFELGEPSLPYIKYLPRFSDRTMSHPKVRAIVRELNYP